MPPLNLYARVRILPSILHTRPRVQRAPGFPCALFFRGREKNASLGRIPPRDREGVSSMLLVSPRTACGERSETERQRSLRVRGIIRESEPAENPPHPLAAGTARALPGARDLSPQAGRGKETTQAV